MYLFGDSPPDQGAMRGTGVLLVLNAVILFKLFLKRL